VDWPKTIAKNQAALAAVVAGLVAMAGLAEHLPRAVYRTILRVLRPAESAVRRLIFIAARDVVVEPAPVRPWPKGLVIAGKGKGSKSARVPAFQLFDPRKRFDLGQPRRKPFAKPGTGPRSWLVEATGPDSYDAGILCPLFRPRPAAKPAPVPPPIPVPLPDGSVSAKRLQRRLAAIKAALENIPRQAIRMARWKARRAAIRLKRPTILEPLRNGPPPGHRKEPVEDVDVLLNECHSLAKDVMREDSS
jgi:hypothetical protein